MKHKTITAAKKEAKDYYERQCLISGRARDGLAGCHIWGAGAYPELKKYSDNIVPLKFSLHTGNNNTLDWVTYGQEARRPEDRITWLYKHMLDEFKPRFRIQIDRLVMILLEHNIRYEADYE